jgi:hypothetical protein
MKRLLFDIEVSPDIGFFWQPGYRINVGYQQIIKEREVICIAWKNHGENAVSSMTWDNACSDREMLGAFASALRNADELVGHNIDRFDLPWLMGRFAYHGLPPMPLFKTADTLQWARRKFKFNSNRLDYLAKFLGVGGKIETRGDLWRDIVLDNDRVALQEMVAYCRNDVVILEKVYDKLAAHMRAKTHAGVLLGGEKWSCPHCASEHVNHHKRKVSAAGTVQHQMRCVSCGRYSTISSKTYDEYLEAKNKA